MQYRSLFSLLYAGDPTRKTMWRVDLMTVMTVTTVIMMTHITVNGQIDFALRIGQTENYYRNVSFSHSLFKDFHHCLCKGTNQCNVQFSVGGQCPDACLAETVPPQDESNTEDMFGNYYTCTFGPGQTSIICGKSANTVSSTNTSRTTYRLKNSDCPSTCVGFIFTFSDEYILFNSSRLHTDMCGPNCDCPSEETTSQTPSSVVTVTTTKATTIQIPSTTKHAEYNTTRGFTTNSGVHKSDPQSGSERSNDSPPIGIIVGAVVGVIVIIVIIIIIIVVVVLLRRKAKAKASGHAGQETCAMAANGAGVNGKTNSGTSNSYYNTEFSKNSPESHTANNGVVKISGHQDSFHQPIMTNNGVTPVKHPSKPQFSIKDNDSDFGYSKAQLVVPEYNNKTKGKKSHDNYDYVSVDDDVGVPELKPETTRGETPVVKPPKVKDDYAVVDKTRKTDLNQDFGYEHSRTSDGYSTAGNVNQPNPNKDDPDVTGVYSKLHQEVRDIKNPYNVGPNTNDVYSKLHEEEVGDIKNPYNVLPEQQGASDTNSALPSTAHNAQDTKAAKPSKSLPYGKEDYAVVVKTKSTNKPAQTSFQLRNDEN